MSASPTVDIGSSESSMSEDIAAEIVSRKVASAPRDVRDTAKSPGFDLTARTGSSGHRKKGGCSRQTAGEESSEGGGQHGNSGRKKRARSTPDDLELNGRKSAPDLQKESSLWPGADVDGPLQSSLLEEVLAEKKMALLRSPEVMRFLQQRQALLLQASQEAMKQEHEQAFSPGEAEVEEDSQQSS